VSDPGTLAVELRQDAPIPLDLSFTCDPDQVLAIYGPSGSGKTTILRAIAGLYRPARARVSCGGQRWTDTDLRLHVATHHRRVGFVFQEYALFPHLTARDNVLAALRHQPAAQRLPAATDWLDAVHLAELASRRPAELSGGQRQRVALARALAREPAVLLLDEPFAAVDQAVRHHLRDELDEVRRRAPMPVVLVTHDFRDVVRLATHVLLLKSGSIVAMGSLAEITSRTDPPATPDGIGPGSVIDATVRRVDDDRGLAELTFPGGAFWVPVHGLQPGASLRTRVPAREVILAVRPPEGLSLHNILAGQIGEVGPIVDDQMLVQVVVGETRLLAQVTRDAVQRLFLHPGVAVFALVKSVSVEVDDGSVAGGRNDGS